MSMERILPYYTHAYGSKHIIGHELTALQLCQQLRPGRLTSWTTFPPSESNPYMVSLQGSCSPPSLCKKNLHGGKDLA